ncbi:ATP synthase gamma chain [bacterium BMS3Abin01]|nr:ATP synthase gamma chain [bacterium BMS3Abin01]
MAQLQDISRRIASVSNTRKTTKAMEMVAGARLRRAQARIESLRPYAERMIELMQEVARHADTSEKFALLETHEEEKRVGIVMLTGDRGLAGAFNSNILRHGLELHDSIHAEGKEVVWIVIGKKGCSSMRFRGHSLSEAVQGITDRPKYSDAAGIAKSIVDMYASYELDKVHLVYNHFKTPMEQVVTDQVILPMGGEVAEVIAVAEAEGATEGDFIYEPNAAAILNDLLPTYVDTALYRALLESTASEHGARMTAMRSASENAEEMIEHLTLRMNRARQAAITQEILEVVAGAEALS